MTRLQPNLLEAIDVWRGNQRPIPSRPEAVRQLAATGLAATPIIAELLVYFLSVPPDPELDSTISKLRAILKG